MLDLGYIIPFTHQFLFTLFCICEDEEYTLEYEYLTKYYYNESFVFNVQ